MIIEYSNEVKGKHYAYRFTEWEMKTIAKALIPIVKNIEKTIEKIKNDPRNDGSLKFICRIEDLYGDIEVIEEIIVEFGGR